MNDDTQLSNSVKTGVKFAGEYIMPGGSNLVKGDLKQAGIHAILGLAARVVFGFPGLLLVSANSFTKAATGRHLYEHLGLDDDDTTTSHTSDSDVNATRVKSSTTSTQVKTGS
ncbi:MAG TPA: DUF6072 family protein [Pyrinomonadaceae bacterium]|jgi:hypothetical protein